MGSMVQMKPHSLLLPLMCLLAASVPLGAQTARQISPAAPQEKPIQPTAIKAPFDITARESKPDRTIEFRPVDQMSTRDREVAANAESSIAEHARYTGLEFNEGNWTYEQVSCAAFPEHLFLRFMRNNGTGDVSLFTASIPRNNEGRVRIIPIQLRGYSLFSPAPINALTMSAFNHIRAEENPENAPVSAWLETGLCYAALAGGHPQLEPIDADITQAKKIALNKGLLQIESTGGATISFDDVSATPRPMHWSMTFDGKGKLVKATHSTAEMLSIDPIKPAPTPAGTTIAANPPAAGSRIPAPAPGSVVVHPIAPPAANSFKPIPLVGGDLAKPVAPPRN